MMKIGMIGNIPTPTGGAYVFAEDLIRGLIKSNHKVVLARWKEWTCQYPDHRNKYIYRHDDYVRVNNVFKIYSIFRYPSWFYLKAWVDILLQGIKLAKIFRSEDVNVLHCHSSTHHNLYFAFIAAKLLKKPLVITIHGLVDFSSIPGYHRYYRKFLLKLLIFILKRANKVIAVSEEIKEVCLYYGIKNVEKLHCGIDVNYFCPQNNLKGEGILYIGKANLNKGVRILLQSYRDIADRIDDDLILVGRGLDTDTGIIRDVMLRGDTNKNIDVKKRIHFEGEKSRKEILELINRSRVVVLPSFSEGLPLAILEAMACGKIVIVSNVGELQMVIKDGENGFLVEPGDVEGLSYVLIKILKNFDSYKRVGIKARQTAKKFNIKKAVAGYTHIYNSLCY